MALAHAMWVHGHGLEIEYPDRGTVELKGFHGRVIGNDFSSNWCHFAIPTPVIVNDDRLRVGSVLIRFRTGAAAWIYAVHIWDGERLLARHDDLHLGPTELETSRFDFQNDPEVQWGIGISVGLAFGDTAGFSGPSSELLSVYVVGAGCDFVPPTYRPVVLGGTELARELARE